MSTLHTHPIAVVPAVAPEPMAVDEVRQVRSWFVRVLNGPAR